LGSGDRQDVATVETLPQFLTFDPDIYKASASP
jgi:hypothetical protein